MKMARLFSCNEYIDIVLAYGEASGVLLASREFPCYFFLWGVHEGLGILLRSQLIQLKF
jgi:hypothetical protein